MQSYRITTYDSRGQSEAVHYIEANCDEAAIDAAEEIIGDLDLGFKIENIDGPNTFLTASRPRRSNLRDRILRALADHDIYLHDIWDRIRGDLRYANVCILYFIYRQGFVIGAEAEHMKWRLDLWHYAGFSPYAIKELTDDA